MTNIQRFAQAKPQGWEDAATVTRLLLPDGSTAEGVVALGYAWDATSGGFVRLNVDHGTGALNVNVFGSDLANAAKTFVNISAGSTDATVVSAQASKKIRVLAFAAVCGATATNLTFNSKPGGAGSPISMTFQNAANGGEVLGMNPLGWFDTNTGEGLSATTGGGSQTGVQVVYTLV